MSIKLKPIGTRRLKVGAKVRFRFAGQTLRATVVDDFGYIGVGGRQLVSIRIPPTKYSDERIFDMPAEELSVIKPHVRANGVHRL